MRPIPPIDLAQSLRDFRRTWPQLVLTQLLALALIIVAITPLVTGLIKLFLIFADDGVLTDADIAVFLLHPIGLTAVIVVGSISLGVFFAQQGALMVIGYGALEDRRVTWLDAVRYVALHARALTRVGLVALVRLLPAAALFVAVVGGIYVLLLGEHDINYYLAHRTSELGWALVLAAIVATVFAIVVLRLLAGWLLALPLTLLEGIGGREALNASAATQPMIRRAHRRGIKVYVWTVNDPIRMSVLMSRGVDGIITDEPGIARRVLEHREGLSFFGRLVVWIAGETGLLRIDEQASTEEDA